MARRRRPPSSSSSSPVLKQDDAVGHRRMAQAGALAAMYPYAEGSGFKNQQGDRGFGEFVSGATTFNAGVMHTRGYFEYCFNHHRTDSNTPLILDAKKPIYRVDIINYPYVLFDYDKLNLETRAGAAKSTNIIIEINSNTQPTPSNRTPVTLDDNNLDWEKVLHEIKQAEIGDAAVRDLLQGRVTLDMTEFLNNKEVSSETRKVLGITDQQSITSTTVVDPKKLKEIIDNAHKIAIATTVTVALDDKFSPRLGYPQPLTIINGFMPRLGRNGSDGFDLGKYADKEILKVDKKDALKQAYYESILTQMKAAQAAGKNGLVIAPPNAFLYGLDAINQNEAKKLWFQAADQAATEIQGFKLIVSDFGNQLNSLMPLQSKKFDVCSTDAVDYAIQSDYACSIGGHPTQPEGNGARSSAAATAFEENLYRRLMLGDLGVVRGGEPFQRKAASTGQQPLTATGQQPSWIKKSNNARGIQAILPFKNAGPGKDFQNTTSPSDNLKVKQNNIEGSSNLPKEIQDLTWGNSEAAFHAQKLIGYYRQLSDLPKSIEVKVDDQKKLIVEMLKIMANESTTKTYMPKKMGNKDTRPNYLDLITRNYENLKNNDCRIIQERRNAFGNDDNEKNKNAFDRVCGAHYFPSIAKNNISVTEMMVQHNGKEVPRNYVYMLHTVKAKLHENGELCGNAIVYAKRGVFPVEISGSDSVWATGSNGDGKNLLGIAILEAANSFIDEKDRAIPDPWSAWNEYIQGKTSSFKHDVLKDKQDLLNSQDFKKLTEEEKKNLSITRPAPPRRHGENKSASSSTATVVGADPFSEKEEEGKKELLEGSLEKVNEIFENLKSDNQEPISFLKKEINIDDDDTTEIKLSAMRGTNSLGDVTLTRKDDTQGNKVTWTCDAAGLSEKERFQLIAAESFVLRSESGMDEKEAKRIGIVELEANEQGARGNVDLPNNQT